MAENNNIWLSGVMGVATGDALGCPVQFKSRKEVAHYPIKGMRGYGTFHLPEGSWTDDSSLTLATLESILRIKGIDLDDIMENFMKWLYDGEFTPYGESFDIGRGTMQAINRYKKYRNARKCGGDDDHNNGNGSLMRILPVCIYCSQMMQEGKISEREAIELVHGVGGLTHAHIRSNIACGLYFFMVHEILSGEGDLQDRLQAGVTRGFAFYEAYLADKENLHYYDRLQDLDRFAENTPAQIKSGGYVVDMTWKEGRVVEDTIWNQTGKQRKVTLVCNGREQLLKIKGKNKKVIRLK